MFSRVVPSILFVMLTLLAFPSNAKVTLSCDRPATLDFDHSQSPTLEAVIESNEMLKQYGVEAQAYIKCLQKAIVSERDEILAEIKSFREKSSKFREAYINK